MSDSSRNRRSRRGRRARTWTAHDTWRWMTFEERERARVQGWTIAQLGAPGCRCPRCGWRFTP